MKKFSFNKGVLFGLLLLIVSCSTLEHTTEEVHHEEKLSGLKYRVLEPGSNIMPEENDLLKIHYIAKVKDGPVFYNSYEHQEPLTFYIGKGHVIKGWEEGLLLMSEGEKAEFIVPPGLAYGDKGIPDVPPNTDVKFLIEIIKIIKPEKPFKPDLSSFISTEKGVKYHVKTHGSGKEIEQGDLVKINYHGYFEDGKSFVNSTEMSEKLEFVVGENMIIEGLDFGVQKLREGDKATFWMPYQLTYGKKGRGPVPSETNVMFDVEIYEVNSPLQPEPFNIDEKDTVETKSGLQCIFVEKTNNIRPEQGDLVEVHYTIYLTDGTIFDSSIIRNEPFRFVAVSRQVISGMDKAVMVMSKGDKTRFIVPPELAYGDQKVNNIIPPGSTLFFDIELLDIKKKGTH